MGFMEFWHRKFKRTPEAEGIIPEKGGKDPPAVVRTKSAKGIREKDRKPELRVFVVLDWGPSPIMGLTFSENSGWVDNSAKRVPYPIEWPTYPIEAIMRDGEHLVLTS